MGSQPGEKEFSFVLGRKKAEKKKFVASDYWKEIQVEKKASQRKRRNQGGTDRPKRGRCMTLKKYRTYRIIAGTSTDLLPVTGGSLPDYWKLSWGICA